jgi:hypothetical protein
MPGEARISQRMAELVEQDFQPSEAAGIVQAEEIDRLRREMVDSLAYTVNRLVEEVHQLRLDLGKMPVMRVAVMKQGQVVIPPGGTILPKGGG